MSKLKAVVVTPDGERLETKIDPEKGSRRKRFPLGSVAYVPGSYPYRYGRKTANGFCVTEGKEGV